MNPTQDSTPAGDRTYQRRRQALVRPGLQLKLTALFVGLAVTGLCLEFLLLAWLFNDVVDQLGADPNANHTLLVSTTFQGLGWTAALVLPLTVVAGVLGTFRFAGPLVRLTEFLTAVANGERPEDCRLRKQDELQDLCALVNEATEPLRRPNAAGGRDAA